MGDDPDDTTHIDANRKRGDPDDPTPDWGDAVDADRQNSLLTKKQRAYIAGQHHPNHERVFRTRLRDRVRHGMYDGLVLTGLAAHDRDLVFHPQAGHEATEANVWAGAVGLLQFVYEGLGEEFGDALEEAISRARRATSVEVTVTETTETSSYTGRAPFQVARESESEADDGNDGDADGDGDGDEGEN